MTRIRTRNQSKPQTQKLKLPSSQKPHKGLIEILKKHSGRDSKGRITVRHQGGRQKRYYRIIDFKRDKKDIEGTVLRIEYDPNRNAHIALINYKDGEKRYILQPQGLKVGDTIIAKDDAEIKTGNSLLLKNIPIGIEVHNVELHPNQGGKMIRGAGTSATVLAKDNTYVHLKLPSGEVRLFFQNCAATVGRVGNVKHRFEQIGSAGRKRRMGIRPTVRGVAQHPGAHPHGGGEGRSGEGMHPKTPWGKAARGKRTRWRKKASNKFIVKRRKK